MLYWPFHIPYFIFLVIWLFKVVESVSWVEHWDRGAKELISCPAWAGSSALSGWHDLYSNLGRCPRRPRSSNWHQCVTITGNRRYSDYTCFPPSWVFCMWRPAHPGTGNRRYSDYTCFPPSWIFCMWRPAHPGNPPFFTVEGSQTKLLS